MANLNLKTDEGLLEACKRAEADMDGSDIARVAHFLEQIHNTRPEDRSGETFVRLVWEENPLCQLGHGDYPLEKAYKDADFRTDFAEAINRTLPPPAQVQQRLVTLNRLVTQTGRLAKKHVEPNRGGKRDVPVTKTLRALAALFPFDFTPPANPPQLTRLAKAMDIPLKMRKHSYAQCPEKSRGIIDRLDKVLGSPPESGWSGLATRRLLAQNLGNVYSEPVPELPEELQPLTASKRLRKV